MDEDRILLARLRGIFLQYIDMLQNWDDFREHPKDIYSEFQGSFVDEEPLNPKANHAYIHMSNAFVYEVKDLPPDDLCYELEVFVRTLDRLITWDEEYEEYLKERSSSS